MIARKEHIVTDQGNGAAFCSNCNENLGSDPFTQPDVCPKCGATLIEGSIWISPGGSDF